MPIKQNLKQIFYIGQQQTYPRRAITTPDMYAIIPGSVFVEVSISAKQCGQIIWVDWGPTGTTVVKIVGPFSTKIIIKLLGKFRNISNFI